MKELIKFEEAHKIVMNQNITKVEEYRIWIKNNKHLNIPYNPDRYYKNKGWMNFQHFFGKNYKRKNFLNYEDCKLIVLKNNIKSHMEFFKWGKPDNIPSSPNMVYK